MVGAAVKVAQGGSEIHAGGVEQRRRRARTIRGQAEELAADGADLGALRNGVEHGTDAAGFENHVRVQAEHPRVARLPDGLVLGRGEAAVVGVADERNAIGVALQHLQGCVLGGVVHHHQVERDTFLGEQRVETALDVRGAVVGDDCDGDALQRR